MHLISVVAKYSIPFVRDPIEPRRFFPIARCRLPNRIVKPGNDIPISTLLLG